MHTQKPTTQKKVFNILLPYLYIAPMAIVTFVFVIYPFFINFSYSFVQWDGFGEKVFIGLQNFVQLASDERFWSAFQSNIIYFFFIVALPIILGLFIASLLARSLSRGARFFQTIYFIPQVVATIALGTIFRWIYAPRFGVFNELLELIGLGHLTQPWLGNPKTAVIAVGFIGTWAWLGFCIIIFVAGIQKIDPCLYEASLLDGAGSVQQFFYITLPELRFEMPVVLIMTTVQCLGSFAFAVAQTTTNGAYGTRPIALYAYQLAFVEGKMGYASAIVVILTAILFGVALLNAFLGEKED